MANRSRSTDTHTREIVQSQQPIVARRLTPASHVSGHVDRLAGNYAVFIPQLGASDTHHRGPSHTQSYFALDGKVCRMALDNRT